LNARERILAAWSGQKADHVPHTTSCFGFSPPPNLRWTRDGVERTFWYTGRLEHLHKLPQPWTVEDDFDRARAWRSLGIDDVLDVSVPWSMDPAVTFTDREEPAGALDERYPVMVRDYQTPGGALRHAVKKTGEEGGPGWVIQPDNVPLIEDFNIPRAVEHAVAIPADVDKVEYLYRPPDAAGRAWFADRMARVKAFADAEGFPVQAWASFGMDAVVWFAGAEGAVIMAMDEPEAFGRLMDIVTETDLARAGLAATTPGVDMVCERGWYSSTDFWSPALFGQFLFPHIKALADMIHQHGRKFGYVMTTGVEILGPRLADAGVDVLYFVDPIQDRIPLETARDLLGSRMTLVGGTNALSLQSDDPGRIKREVAEAVRVLGPTNRFILHPVDAIFPDTPWEGVTRLIGAWKEACGL
jgi:hypothetical protein